MFAAEPTALTPLVATTVLAEMDTLEMEKSVQMLMSVGVYHVLRCVETLTAVSTATALSLDMKLL
jgi:hypothetical protein